MAPGTTGVRGPFASLRAVLLVALSAGWTVAPAAAQSQTDSVTVMSGPVVPAAGRRLSGAARVVEEPSGALWLDVSVTGPADELSRVQFGQPAPNLLWVLVDITCAQIDQLDALGTISGGEAPRLLGSRMAPVPTRPDALDFRVPLEREWLRRPLALTAFCNGCVPSGPLPRFACADLGPSARGTGAAVQSLPAAGGASEAAAVRWGATDAAVTVLLGAFLLRTARMRLRTKS